MCGIKEPRDIIAKLMLCFRKITEEKRLMQMEWHNANKKVQNQTTCCILSRKMESPAIQSSILYVRKEKCSHYEKRKSVNRRILKGIKGRFAFSCIFTLTHVLSASKSSSAFFPLNNYFYLDYKTTNKLNINEFIDLHLLTFT